MTQGRPRQPAWNGGGRPHFSRESHPSMPRTHLRTIIPPGWHDRIQLVMVLLLQLAIFGLFIGALFEQRWELAFTAIGVLALTFLPAIIERQLRLQLPLEFTLVTCLFLYASFGLGEVQQFYERFWWWDTLLHSFSALVMGLIGFLTAYVFHMTRRIRMAPFHVALVSFGFAVTVGTLWEIFEFIMDVSFGLNMQRGSLTDTMTDLIVDVVGALIAGWFGYHYVKGGDSMVISRLIRRFLAKNPHLFGHDIGKGTDAGSQQRNR